MCGRYIVVSKLKKIERIFNVKFKGNIPFTQNFNVSPGDKVPIITCDDPGEIKLYRFGLRPFWSKKSMYLINARSEGDNNKDNDLQYHGILGIKNKPSFRKPFRSQRCLVLADAFIEGTNNEKLNKPFVVYPIDKLDRPFAMAGLFDHYIDENSGEITSSFTIITTTAGSLLRLIPHSRSPVIFDNREDERMWLDKNSSVVELENILRPSEEINFNAYPIDAQIKNPRLKGHELIKPIGDRLIKEYDYVLHHDIELMGMGMTTSRRRKLDHN